MNLDMDITDRSVTEYINSKYKPPYEKLAPFRNLGERDRIPIIRKETESVLTMLLDLTHPKKIFEIGTAIGYSTAFFAMSCPDAEVVSVEKDEYAFRAAQLNMKNAGVDDRVRLYLGDGQEIADRLREEGEHDFDMVFIDAGKSHYRRFLDSVLEIVSDEALIVSDNILEHGMTASDDYDPKNKHKTNILNMRAYINHLMRDRRFRTTLMSVGDGLAVTRFRRYPDE
ncbi:MAG: O-methyltransferase [Eubacterium sp.]|nr:O-methyltransferase [Eubacterium sp.]